MVKRWVPRVLFLAVLATVCWWGWGVIFPNPKSIIRKRMVELAHLASFAPNEGPLAKLMNSEKMSSYFTENVDIIVDVPGMATQRLTGRDTLLSAETALRNHVPSVNVEFPDINVSLGPDADSASANVTLRGNLAGERDRFEQEMLFLFSRKSGAWLIRHVETVKTLR